MTFENLQKQHLMKLAFSEDDVIEDLYGSQAIARLYFGVQREKSLATLHRVARYLEEEHPTGRDPKGECDFAARDLLAAVKLLGDKLDGETLELIRRFYVTYDFASLYGSENHVFIFRTARFLAAETFGCDFPQYGYTCAEAMAKDKKYLLEFMSFRARYGVGEFTSEYLSTDISITGFLAYMAKDEEVARMARMSTDLLVLEQANNTDRFGHIAGAVGRSYPDFLFAGGECQSRMTGSLCFALEETTVPALYPLTVDDFVIDAIRQRPFPSEVYETKHLHSMSAWMNDEIDRAQLDKLFAAGAIYKYTYLCNEYGLGGINHQDAYPADDTGDARYAHHQQVEWSCMLSGPRGTATKIYTHHPGEIGEHNHWTGDLDCCCSHVYVTKDTALSVFDIEREGQLEFTHLVFEPAKYDKIERAQDRMYLKFGNCYCFIRTSAPYEEKASERVNGISELILQGKKTAYAFRIAKESEFASFTAFKQAMDALAFTFDEKTATLTFDSLWVSPSGNGRNEKENRYECGVVYDTPWCFSRWGEGKLTVRTREKNVVLDFIENKITEG